MSNRGFVGSPRGVDPAARPATYSNAATLANPPQWLLDALGAEKAITGRPVTAATALRVSSVFACVQILARTVSTLPVKVYRRTGDGVEEATSHPLWDLVRTEPNDEMTGVDFRSSVQACLSLHNNAYIEIRSGGRGYPSELWPMHPRHVTPQRDDGGRLYYEIADELDGRGNVIRKGRKLSAGNVIHLKGLSFDGLVGVSSINYWRDVIALAQSLDNNAAKFFSNNSRVGLVLKHPGKIDPEAREYLKSQIEDENKGEDNAHKPLFLQGGLDASVLRGDNESSQMDESRQRQAREICALFGIPPHRAGISENVPRANVEEANRDFVTNTIRPIVTLWEAALNRSLLSRADRQTHFIEFNLAGLERGNLADRYASYAQGRQWGFLSVNEIRKLENLNPVEGGDEYLRPVNMQPVGDEIEPTEPAPVMAPAQPEDPTKDED